MVDNTTLTAARNGYDSAQLTNLSSRRTVGADLQFRDAAHQFESILLKEMMSKLKESACGLVPNDEQEFGPLEDLSMNYLALRLAESGGLGISKFLIRSLSH